MIQISKADWIVGTLWVHVRELQNGPNLLCIKRVTLQSLVDTSNFLEMTNKLSWKAEADGFCVTDGQNKMSVNGPKTSEEMLPI